MQKTQSHSISVLVLDAVEIKPSKWIKGINGSQWQKSKSMPKPFGIWLINGEVRTVYSSRDCGYGLIKCQ